MRRAAFALVLLGCGRLGFEPGGASPNAFAPDAFVPDADLAAACGPAYQIVPGLTSRYRTGAADLTWADAERDCEQDGGHLVAIDDVAENDWVSTQPAGWLGLSDHATEGVFAHVNGAPVGYTNWNLDEPNNDLGDEDCVEMKNTGEWNDNACDITRSYLCECDGAAMPVPAVWCETGTNASCNTCGDACPQGATCLADQTCAIPN